MKKTYQHQEVKVLRAAKKGDPGFDHDKSHPQLLIELPDGSEKVVPAEEVTNGEPAPVGSPPVGADGKPAPAPTSATGLLPDGQPVPTPVAGSPPIDHP